MRQRLIVAASMVAICLSACVTANEASQAKTTAPDIVEVLAEAGEFTTLLRMLEAAEMTDVLKGEGPFTVFAPDDRAFGDLEQGVVAHLLMPANKEALRAMLATHIVPGEFKAAEQAQLTTLDRRTLSVRVTADATLINNAALRRTELKARNGVIYVIDAVIRPTQGEEMVIEAPESR